MWSYRYFHDEVQASLLSLIDFILFAYQKKKKKKERKRKKRRGMLLILSLNMTTDLGV